MKTNDRNASARSDTGESSTERFFECTELVVHCDTKCLKCLGCRVELSAPRNCRLNNLDELAGRAELVVDLSGPLDASFLADALHCAVTNDGPSRLRCATESTPEVVGLVNEALARHGVSIVALRTRASLEERYLDIVSDDQGTAEP